MKSERILVVEDEQIVALDIRLHLEQFGYTVADILPEAELALEFLERNQNNLPDVIIMDIHLQGAMDGVEASEIIRERYELPVVFMTAYADEDTLARAKVTEPFAYIIKPFESRELRTALVLASYRHKMNMQLREREHLLSRVMDAVSSGVLVTDVPGAVRYANVQAEHLLKKHIAAGTPVEAALPSALIKELKDTLALDGTSRASTHWKRTQAEGEIETIEIQVIQFPPQFPGMVWILMDLTDRLNRERALREQEEQLAYSRRMEAVGRMSGGLAHDFNNLVTVMLGYARLALEDIAAQPDLKELRENVQGLYNTAHRSAELTRRLLTVSRTPASARAVFFPDALLTDTLPMIRGLLPENIHLHAATHAGDVSVSADKRGMQQVLINLVLNARDAMPAGGVVHVTTECVRIEERLPTFGRTLEPGSYLRISVADTGEGIDPENLPHVFEPFFTTKDETDGSGFGLATVYSVISDADGAINVSSTRGHGTRFSLYLPLVEHMGTETEQVAREPAPQSLAGSGTVLVVEEENGVRGMLVRTLKNQGYNPVAARSVGDGLLLLDHFTDCRLIVSDCSAPYHTASGVVDLYRTKNPQSRIVLLFGGDSVEAGQNASLEKPFESLELLKTLRRLNATA